jgi:hypothetical protein
MHLVILHNDGFCLFRHVDAVNSTYHPFNEHGMIDIIPDIHGQLEKLESLLTHLGYTKGYRSWVHSERKVLFLGDYIDRGPQVRETLQLVRAMVEAGQALALMGNHELNAVAFHTRGVDGTPLRPHSDKNVAQHKATLESFVGHEDELADYRRFDGKSGTYEIEPLHLLAYHGNWYVLARSRGSDKTFALSRFGKVAPTGKYFKRPARFDWRAFSREAFGIAHGEKPERIRLLFSAHVATYIRERVWHPSQILRQHRDGSLEMRIETSGHKELVRWVFRPGGGPRSRRHENSLPFDNRDAPCSRSAQSPPPSSAASARVPWESNAVPAGCPSPWRGDRSGVQSNISTHARISWIS